MPYACKSAGSCLRPGQLPALALGLLLWTGPSTASESHPAVQQLQDQRQQREQLEQRQRLRTLQRADEASTEIDKQPAPADTGACWPLQGVRLAGNQQLSSAQLSDALTQLILPCMSPAQINQLLKAITQQYLQAGYLASRPYLAAPLVAGGTLDIVIVEGYVESIELADPALPLSLNSAFPSLLGKPLRLTELEQGMDQLNRLKAFELGADILPGSRQGASRVVVVPRQIKRRWHLGGSFDNRGSEQTGRERLGVNLSLDSPLQLNDFVQISANSTLPSGSSYSRGYGVYYSIPYGAWTYAMNFNQLQYQAQLPARRLHSSGQSDFYGLGLERTLWRNQQGLLSASVRMEQKRLENRLGKQRLSLQSPTLTTTEAGLNLLWLGDGLWSAYLGVSQGLDWFGADREALRNNAPEPRFRKYRANFMHLRQGRNPNWPWRWQSDLNLQYSPDVLPAVEQQQLSDTTAVRGFRQQVVAGANGAVWRNTLSQPLALDLPQALVLHPQLGVDLGWSKFSHGTAAQRLAGAHAGLELSLPDSQLKLDYQHAIYASVAPRAALEKGYWLLEWVVNI
ncbi:ShlB/FhaC/HecB family hemolysin secretion/activation protein [Pseudomonas sp. P66]|uniref:ShlB/FhaC/HecB family hemolysin secretion/activation protein n=1 Tax=Pseudomonas arcuscaelestis TaxID=2710591 RepID=A0ABS2BXQ7_9PSED|nr:ShlB/FhaC/HecB family hemolysin secretion/activation protein [Pseudomonas arcuscaelestis]MBM5458397.1 ShlB/FhaC/HecB family hemolysin secretion/activation protein [Pseudomonas arcuscaelestis]